MRLFTYIYTSYIRQIQQQVYKGEERAFTISHATLQGGGFEYYKFYKFDNTVETYVFEIRLIPVMNKRLVFHVARY